MSTDLPGPDSPWRSAGADRDEFSAGGAVVRGDEVVVIVPTRRGAGGAKVLALPKGLIDPGENAEQAALREVREEAGVSARIVAPLGSSEYTYVRDRQRVAKRVQYFLMEYSAGDPADHDHEVEQARWMPLAEAALALTYPGDRATIKRALLRRSHDR